jgi:hypothetical protein
VNDIVETQVTTRSALILNRFIMICWLSRMPKRLHNNEGYSTHSNFKHFKIIKKRKDVCTYDFKEAIGGDAAAAMPLRS